MQVFCCGFSYLLSLPHDLSVFYLQQSKSDTGTAVSFYYKKGNKNNADTGKCFFHCISGPVLF